MNWRSFLQEKTRSRGALLKTITILVGIGLVPAFLIRFSPGVKEQKAFEQFMRDHGPALSGRPDAYLTPIPDHEFREAFENNRTLSGSVKEVADAFDEAIGQIRQGLAPDEVPDLLSRLAGTRPRLRYANRAYGVYWAYRSRWTLAAKAFEEEGRFPEAGESREYAMESWKQVGAWDEVERLSQDPLYADLVGPGILFRLHAAHGEWGKAFWLIWPSQHHDKKIAVYLLTALSGLVWLLFLYQASQPDRALTFRLLLCLLAILSGVLSTVPTVFAALWQDQVLGFRLGEELVPGLMYCIVGIGLREELIKLLFVLPFVPLLMRRGDRLEMLIVAGCVGLGFAVEENVNYFSGGRLIDGGRFLTANFFHIASTGMIGLACCRMVRSPGNFGNDFANRFGLVVVLHGLYDALIIVPDLNDYDYFSFTAFVLLSYLFFGELRGLRENKHYIISLTSIFLFGLTILIMAAYNYAVLQSGNLRDPLVQLAQGLLALGAIIYMYLREIPEQIAD